MKATLRIALAQINCCVGDIQGNLKKIEKYIEKAKKNGADIVAFPELALCGYPPEDLLLNRQFIKDNKKAIAGLAEKNEGITVIAGFPCEKEGKLFNAAAIIGAEGGGLRTYFKIYLPNYGVFDEKRYFTPGEEPLVIDAKGYKVGVNICEDIWEETGPILEQKAAGAEIIINLSASPFYAGKKDVRKRLVQSRAASSNVPVLFVNLVGGQDELVFDGNSLAVDAKGSIKAQGPGFKENLIIVDVQQGKQSSEAGVKAVCGHEDAPLSGVGEVVAAIELGIRDYVAKNGFSRVTFGLSGGIDSALVAVLAVRALGKESVTAVSMPSIYSSKETQRDARRVAENLGIEFKEIPITDIFETSLAALEPHFQGTPVGIAEENLQARVRGNILMALSNKFGWLLLATGNKSELSVGYSTLYGDLCGGFAPIKDVPKTIVYQIARHLNSKKELIPESVIERAPSAELRPGQKDTDSLPPYDVLDRILQGFVEEDLPLDQLTEKGFDSALVAKIVNMVNKSEHKRRQAPPGVKITPRAFGRDRRFPITNKFQAT